MIDGNEIGRQAEDAVERALESLKDEGIVKSWVRSEWMDQSDQVGIDFKVFLPHIEEPIPLQVKASHHDAYRHYSRYRQPYIYLVVAKHHHEILPRLLTIFLRYTK